MTLCTDIAMRTYGTRQVSGDGVYAHVQPRFNQPPLVTLYPEDWRARSAASQNGGRVEKLVLPKPKFVELGWE
jgi:hypothetical protein